MDDAAGMDGWPAYNVFDSAFATYHYDDIVFMPGHVSCEAAAIDVTSQLTKDIKLRTPIISSSQVTEDEMAIKMALAGGLGVIHRNQPAQDQAEMVRIVKRFMHGKILAPATLAPENTIADWAELAWSRGVESLSVPITEGGKLGEKLVGLVTARDAGYLHARTKQTRDVAQNDPDVQNDPRTPLRDVMVTDVVTAKASLSLQDAQDFLRSTKKGKLLLVDDDYQLVSMVTRSDLRKANDYPLVSRDENGQLLVGASVAVDDWKRARLIIEAGVDVLFVDVNMGDLESQLEFVGKLKADHPHVRIAVGLVSSARKAKRFIEAGADTIRAGDASPQLACGGEMASVGRGDATAVFNVSRYIRAHFDLPVIADGLTRNSGHILKAFCLGASTVSLDDALLGTDEALRQGLAYDTGSFEKPVPKYADPSGRVVESTGPVMTLVKYIEQGVKRGLQDVGVQDLTALHSALSRGELRMECRCTFAAQVAMARKRSVETSAYPVILPTLPHLPARGPHLC